MVLIVDSPGSRMCLLVYYVPVHKWDPTEYLKIVVQNMTIPNKYHDVGYQQHLAVKSMHTALHINFNKPPN